MSTNFPRKSAGTASVRPSVVVTLKAVAGWPTFRACAGLKLQNTEVDRFVAPPVGNGWDLHSCMAE